MPTYDYECDGCGNTLEIIQSFQDNPKKKCPKCGAFKMRRLISGGLGIVFKGKGFYVKDSVAQPLSNNSKTTTDSKEHNESNTDSNTKPTELNSSIEQSSSETNKKSKPDSTSNAKTTAQKNNSPSSKKTEQTS